ncbi:ATPase_AAA_core domain-containing protein, partial [Haematococcus lacustris]
MWREGMMELLDQLEAENPEDTALAPKDLSEWACIYIKYIQILRKLETAYDQMVHPQKRLDMRKALEACIGRQLEIRHWMVKLNRGLDFVSLDDILVDLKLSPDVLEVPVPKYFIEDRAKELDDRDKFLEALVEKYNVKAPQHSPIIRIGAPLPEEEAIMIIQKNERGEGTGQLGK